MQSIIYLDNAATTKKKPFSVIKETILNTLKYSSNPGRAGHSLSILAGKKVFETREVINRFFNGYGNVIFTSGCTESLNIVILGLFNKASSVRPHVITSMLEHNSVLRPLHHLEKEGKITLAILPPNKESTISSADIEKAITSNTKAVILTARSNVIGVSTNLKQIGALCKAKNLLFIVDAAQAAGHDKIDMQASNISALCAPSHKGLFGLMGGGILLLNNTINISPLKFGGTGINSAELIQPAILPEKLESGTLPLPAILSMKTGAEFCEKHSAEIEKKEKELTEFLISELVKIKDIKIYGKNQSGVVSFNYKNIDSSLISERLNEKRIYIRAGLHCAPLVHKFFGTTIQGMCRISLSYLTKKRELEKFISALKDIISSL